MTSKDESPDNAAAAALAGQALRRKAQALAGGESATSMESMRLLSGADTRLILHELRVHQIELEMQNEELRRAQVALDTERARYVDLYDLAPVGYCSVSESGLILQVNLTAAALLGVARGALLRQPVSLFILNEDQDIYYLCRRLLLATGEPQSCELRMVRRDGTQFWAHLATTTAHGEGGTPLHRIVLSDITQRRQTQARTQAQAQAALQESEAFSCAILDSISAEIAVLDRDGVILAVNQPWRRFAADNGGGGGGGGGPGQPVLKTEVGANYLAVCDASTGFASDGAMNARVGILAVLGGSLPSFTLEYPCHSPSQQRWFSMSVTPLGPDHQRVVVSHTDISERVKADKKIRMLSRITEQAPMSIVITDLAGAIEYTNPYFSEITGYTFEEVRGQNPRMLSSGQTLPNVYRNMWQTLTAGRTWHGEFHNRKKNGDIFAEQAVIIAVLDADGRATHYVALKEDVTERIRLEHKRLSLSVRLDELSRQLVQAQEASRRRFSAELHDRTSPNLAALRINLDIISAASPQARDSQSFADRVEDTRALIEDTTLSIRDICAELHPPVLDLGGLLGVVQSYAQQFAKRTGLLVRVQCPHGEVRLAPDMELCLFRILQEALTNCAKHANAKVVEVTLQLDSDPMLLSVSDDGMGFDPEPVSGARPVKGLGLLNMRETAEFVGGRFRLESAPGKGTRVQVEI